MNITLSGTKITQDTRNLAFEKNNNVDEIVITVDTDESWSYKLDVKYPDKYNIGNDALYNIIDLDRNGNICSITLTSEMLPFNGKYTMQLRGINGDKVYHSDTFEVWVKYSIEPGSTYDPVPSEFYQVEAKIDKQFNDIKNYADKAAQSASGAAQSAQEAANSAAVYDTVVADVNQLKQDLSAEQTAREEADNALRADLTANANADAVTKRSLDALWKLNQGISYQFETDDTEAYLKTVPSGAKLASVETVGGKTLVWNQWVLPISSENVSAESNSKVSVSDGIVTMYPSGEGNYSSFICRSNFRRKANAKYYLRYTAKSSAWSQNVENAGLPIVQGLWVASAAVDKSVTDWQTKSAIFDGTSEGTGSTVFSFRKYAEPSNAIVYVKDIVVINLTMLYGHGNEPSSLDDPRIAWIEQYATEHFEYNAGALVSADVESVVYDGAVAGNIPDAVRNLPGYGWSAGDVRNSFERTDTGWQYVQRVGSREYQEGDTVTDGVTTYYALGNPVITDITDLMDGILDAITVESGGTLTFENAAKLPTPNTVEYAVKLSEVSA